MYTQTQLENMDSSTTMITTPPVGSLFELNLPDFQWDHETVDLPIFDISKSPSTSTTCVPLTIAKDCSTLSGVNAEDCFDPESSSMLLDDFHPEVALHSEIPNLSDELQEFLNDCMVPQHQEQEQQEQHHHHHQTQAEAPSPSPSTGGVKTEINVESEQDPSSSSDSDSQMDEDEDQNDEQQDVKPDAESLSKMSSALPESDDPLDKHIYTMFPMEVLRLERSSFNKWKKTNRTRKLKPDETKRLAKIRRTILARVYAERARQRRDADHKGTKAECTELRAENARLKAHIAKLEKQRR
eukprot:m.213886 g.213886  ORF g.213886 m.213886 type:complete len:298 (-) comp33163_c1_seq1:696-1589(-)